MPSRTSNTLQGAAGGAMTGAAAGSVFGPWGTAIGGVGGGLIGGLSGYFGSDGQDPGLTDEQRAMYEAYIRSNAYAPAPTSPLRKNQLSLISDLEAQSQGRGPSLAAAQLEAALDKNRKDQQGYANSARGSAIPLAAFQAQNNISALGAQAGQDATAARIAEQVAARNQLGLTLHGARGMDEETALRQRAMNDELMARGMSTFQGTPYQVSTGQQMFAGGVGSLGTLAQSYSAKAAKAPAYQGSDYSRTYGDNTMNPFQTRPA